MAGLLARVLMNNSAGLYPPARNGTARTGKRGRRKVKAAKKSRKRATKVVRGRLKKGSAAAKRYMASIRKKRRR